MVKLSEILKNWNSERVRKNDGRRDRAMKRIRGKYDEDTSDEEFDSHLSSIFGRAEIRAEMAGERLYNGLKVAGRGTLAVARVGGRTVSAVGRGIGNGASFTWDVYKGMPRLEKGLAGAAILTIGIGAGGLIYQHRGSDEEALEEPAPVEEVAEAPQLSLLEKLGTGVTDIGEGALNGMIGAGNWTADKVSSLWRDDADSLAAGDGEPDPEDDEDPLYTQGEVNNLLTQEYDAGEARTAEAVSAAVAATRDSVAKRVYEEYKERMQRYGEQISGLGGLVERERKSRRESEEALKRRTASVESWANHARGKNRTIAELAGAFLTGEPDSAAVMQAILDGSAILPGEQAKAYDPRAQEGEVYIFSRHPQTGEPTGFGYRLGEKSNE